MTVGTFLPLAVFLIAVGCPYVGAQGVEDISEFKAHTKRFPKPPGLIFCSPAFPCGYGEGHCGGLGDEGCVSGLVCGVSNCGSFEPGMYGSCCAESSPPTYEIEDVPDSQAQGGNTEWGSWYQDPHSV